uniref:Uncharacterized protein n=1 Tax=viral metagenome TaxID=1070528 RepID=A0A6C0LLP0_9ZZZZ
MKKEGANEGYYLLFFIFVGLLIFLVYYNQQQQSAYSPYSAQVLQTSQQATQVSQLPKQSIHQYHTQEHQQMTKKTNNMDYTYNIENIDIHKDNLSNNNENKLGGANAANSKYEPELDEVFGTTLRGNTNDSNNEPDEMFNYCIKPNKSDLPIVNPPLQLLLNNAPLRLSERHSM